MLSELVLSTHSRNAQFSDSEFLEFVRLAGGVIRIVITTSELVFWVYLVELLQEMIL